MRLIGLLLLIRVMRVTSYCEEGLLCSECDLLKDGGPCNTYEKLPYYYCNNSTRTVDHHPSMYYICADNIFHSLDCATSEIPSIFNSISRQCMKIEEFENDFIRRKRSATGSSRVGDICSFNTDCQRGMFCGGGVCNCLSDFVSISQHCWPKVNPGESGCIESRQCEAVWPGTTCSHSGICECPIDTVPSRTRDGTVCVSSLIPPACPLPESHNGFPNPATVLANPSTHPLNLGNYMPVLCTSTSLETRISNGGDGSTWCIYPDGEDDVFIADIYNCVSHPQVNNELFPEYAESVDGICCHNRAFVCAQPLESGSEPSVPRWWFNSATGTCIQFMWDPDTIQEASPNNFRTIEHCESYCRDTCKRGITEFIPSKYAILDEVPKTNCQSTISKCNQEHSCTLIGSQQACCPTTAHICSAHGGRTYLSKPVENYDRGMLIAGNKATTRYYYDAEQGRCVNFMYYGLGNFNNFVTKQDCETFCSKLVCENGNPLRIGEEWQRCETNTDCPSSHSCQGNHKVCCPTAQSLCTQPKRLGDCTSSVRRYWYNAATRQCEMFHYTGCQGNDNNFASLVACQQKCRGINVEPKCAHGVAYRDRDGHFLQCSEKQNGAKCPVNYICTFDGITNGCCPTKGFTCSLNPDKGIQCGSGRSYRYYFNPNKQSCETFQYKGCDGNSNNFLTSEDCQQYCGVGGCPNGGTPLRDERSNQQMACSELHPCPFTHECQVIPLNGNVAHRCCPTKAHICSQPPQQGNQCSKISVTRYYFNIVTKECATFQYNGCNGNLNNFLSIVECNNFCFSASCGAGEIAYRDVNTKKTYDCNNSIKNSCPLNFQCRFNSLTSSFVCCGSGNTDVCPKEERAYINALDESIRECAINVPGSCPANFLCRFSSGKNRYYCCAPTTSNVCPDGRALYRVSKSLLPVRCTMNSPNVCADGYSCQSRSVGVLQGFCCSARNVCKGDAEFLMDEKTKMPRICTPGAFISCPVGYRCYRHSPFLTNGFCCKGEITAFSEGCPPNEYAFTHKGQVTTCDPFNPENKGCPTTFSCQFSITFQRYQCCGKDPIEEEEFEQKELGCPLSQVALVEKGNPVVCTVSGQNCPIGYFCQFSDKNRQFQCCAHKSDCPKDSVAYLNLMGSAVECSMKIFTCPEGYSCQKSIRGKEICCSDTTKPILTEKKGSIRIAEMTNPITTTSASKEFQKTGEIITFSKKNCPTNMIMTNGECKVRGSLGASCLHSSQCMGDAECLDLLCVCKNKNVKKDEQCKSFVTCATDEEEVGGKCLQHSIIGEDCEDDKQCRNGAQCRIGKCRCTEGTAPYKERCLANLCGLGKSPLVNNESTTVLCVNTKCTKPTVCTYSKIISTYLCCFLNSNVKKVATVWRKETGHTKSTEVQAITLKHYMKKNCPDGQLPIFIKSTKLPLLCTPNRACPIGYSCIARKCCPSRRRKRNISCPRGYIQVQYQEEASRCESLCIRSHSQQCHHRRRRI